MFSKYFMSDQLVTPCGEQGTYFMLLITNFLTQHPKKEAHCCSSLSAC